jgi:hypothetical protein
MNQIVWSGFNETIQKCITLLATWRSTFVRVAVSGSAQRDEGTGGGAAVAAGLLIFAAAAVC